MNAIDYLMSRLTLFCIACIFWLFLNGGLYVQVESLRQEPLYKNAPESNEPLRINKSRPVNLMIINDPSNRIADESIVQSLNGIYEAHSNLIGKVTKVPVYGDDPKEDLERICNIWDELIEKESSNVPDLVLDTTTSGYVAETVSAFTGAVGVPTLSAQYGLEGDMKNWEIHNRSQYKHLVQIIPSMDLISEAARQFAYQMNISNAAVIFDDENFIMDYRYKNFFYKSKTRFVVLPMRRTSEEVRQLLFQMRRLDIVNIFLIGNVSSVRTVLDVGCSNNFVSPEYAWYILSHYDQQLHCDCKELSIINLKPLTTTQERENKLGFGKWPIEQMLTAAFYFDFAQLGITAMKASISQGKWPTNSEYLTCKAFNGTNTPNIHFDYYSELVKTSIESNRHPFPLSFAWGGRNGRNYAKFEMTAELITFKYGKLAKSESVAIWRGERLSPFMTEYEEVIKQHIGRLRYRITTVLKAPFVMYNVETKVWSGYCIDLIDKLASKLNFTYSISAVEDQEYGMDRNGSWSGMIGELLLKRADIALGALSVMSERESVIDFTVPYYDLVGFSILMRKPKRPTHLFKFLSVLSDEVWLCILGCLFLTSIFLAIFNRWSPYSYRNNLEKFKDDDEKRDFTLRESLWFSMTSFTPQGGGIAPKNLSGRLLSATWWLFGFIIIASHTANLSAFLTISRLETMVESLDDLSKQYRIQYAPIFGSEAYMYFKRMADIEEHFYDIWRDLILNSKISELERSGFGVYEYPLNYEFTKMLQSMTDFKFPHNISEALERVRRENNRTEEFAFIGDATDIRYLTMLNCDLQEVGSEFSRKPYALAVQQGSPLRETLNNAILELLNERELEKLQNRWWKNNPAQVECEEPELLSDGISMANIGGIFLVTFTGIGVAILTLMFEYYWYRVRPRSNRNLNRNTSPTAKKKTKKLSPQPSKIAFK